MLHGYKFFETRPVEDLKVQPLFMDGHGLRDYLTNRAQQKGWHPEPLLAASFYLCSWRGLAYRIPAARTSKKFMKSK